VITPAAYLMGLGLWRVTAEMDPATRAIWEGDSLHLVRDGTIRDEREYLLERWHPTPVLNPWNSPLPDKVYAGIEHSNTSRLTEYREAISAMRRLPDGLPKPALVRAWRATCPDRALSWVDACLVEQGGNPEEMLHNWLLGSGGNDGRLDFARNYLRAVDAIMDPATGASTRLSRAWLDALLGVTVATPLPCELPGGQFFGGNTVSPWHWLLAMEGCILLGEAGLWRYRPEVADWPNLCGHTEEADGCEIWAPVMRSPVTLAEFRDLLGNWPVTNASSGAMIAMRLVRQREGDGCVQWYRMARSQTNGLAHLLTPEGLYPA
jgi:CRISPR-associated protein Csx17